MRDVLPNIEAFWIETYGRVAITGEPAQLERRSAPLGKWFRVTAFSPRRGHFATLSEDITPRRNAEERMRACNAELENRVKEHIQALEHANQALREQVIDGLRRGFAGLV